MFSRMMSNIRLPIFKLQFISFMSFYIICSFSLAQESKKLPKWELIKPQIEALWTYDLEPYEELLEFNVLMRQNETDSLIGFMNAETTNSIQILNVSGQFINIPKDKILGWKSIAINGELLERFDPTSIFVCRYPYLSVYDGCHR